MQTPLIALAATAMMMAGAPAIAFEESEDMVVAYTDLDLTTKAGQKTLERRIDAAARKYCRVDAQRSGTRMASAAGTKCYREAKRLATQQFAVIVNDARLGG